MGLPPSRRISECALAKALFTDHLHQHHAPFADSSGYDLNHGLMGVKNRVAQASSAQGVEHGINAAGRTFVHDTIPTNTRNVAARVDLKCSTPGDHAAFTRAGREIHAVEKPENALPQPIESMTMRPTSPRVQSPIDRLPNELLCAIFLLTGDPSPVSGFPRDQDMHDNGLHPFAVKLYSQAAVTIGRVCSRWMHVACGFPALWTVVDVTYPGARATAILKRCLKYSAGLPLVLWLSRRVNPDDSYYGVDPRFMRLVAANAHRWVEISIQLGDECHALQPLIALPPGSFTALRRARIEFALIHVTDNSLDTLLWRSFYTSPHLVALDWNRTQYIQYSLSSAPLRQLTELGVYSTEPGMLLPILLNCTALEVLFVHIDWPWGPEEDNGTIPLASPVCLPRLRALALRGPYDWAPLFSVLEAPSLKRLDLSHMDIKHADIEKMLRRSSAGLMMLTVYWPAMDQGDNIIALLHSPAMRHLRVVRYECAYPGASEFGWEESFDLRPSVPSHMYYTTRYAEAEEYYRMICTTTNPGVV
ncbi:uncharacterized protein SCHCODRAFT_02557911 [Schizophyllum commune H4-8]|nr:uncharacterized protein SCHCODRAFT_02564183 [Schizophyllum commune H4-8]XP_050197184.1 uncharacterized protein SCHCODRAFT_02557911 [Schizophyllum commune H4-8]KAI5885465.1 hypothetical protein SCHCODRAFT_02557911 [Schizophyllum commune H4-8]KAI5898976.1 hypothetical protein SCHCODRAFT_02564183 [Schizophyllum commune H4-8]